MNDKVKVQTKLNTKTYHWIHFIFKRFQDEIFILSDSVNQ